MLCALVKQGMVDAIVIKKSMSVKASLARMGHPALIRSTIMSVPVKLALKETIVIKK